ncbi:LacI family DNA-binding transcriptional regulator [Mycolicibacterium brisbanense]|uniref:LacI family transcriptional regulator n=1 Tax=Mycolicibacterium brisbanense TaxID=146020 RepID=A0A117I604_9MYCO|nr:LacI family DNA-binding transcriptional regulator [Mycolicibacterium brisbanense]MCV7161832.1 LacI family DNA-binding transcriptional regulator [Mycolicibacterium brisbanense]GAS89343.1 LacI family transcriptional regulator [Mycolicibacterium brisbanense]
MAERRVRPTIHDVARRAGVSATTVSHTFSGKGVVAAGTREHVREVARAMGYRPDAVARGLRNNRLGVIALVLRPLETLDSFLPEGVDYFLRFAGQAALAAMELGYGLMLVSDPTQDSSPAAALACDGFLITEPVQNDPLVAMLTEERMPFLTVGRDPENAGYDSWIDTGTTPMTLQVLDHLRGSGARRIALVTGTDRNSWNIDAEAAYRSWTAQREQDPLVVHQPETAGLAGGSAAYRELFSATSFPDAVYCLTGRHAAGLLTALTEGGLRVPHDVQLIAGSDSEHTRSATPPITAIDLGPELLARVAVTRLANHLDAVDRPIPTGDLQGRLIVRGSTR